MTSHYTALIRKTYKASIKPIQDDLKLRKDRDFFWPTGTQVYVGRQGDGKTISAIKHMLDLKKRYPSCIVVTNLHLNGYNARVLQLTPAQEDYLAELSPRAADNQTSKYLIANLAELLRDFNPQNDYIQFSSMEELAIVLTKVNNGFKGVVYIIDEIHTYLNALESKNVPMYVFTEISQQRKQRKAIIGTSQLFMRVAKPIREQCDNMIVCKTYFGVFTYHKCYDGATVELDISGHLLGDLRRRGWFFHTREIRAAFDTYQKVVSGSEQYETSINNSIVVDRKSLKALKH